MAKKCERCGNPALDDQSEFCNRCGASVRKEPEPSVPVCGRCGNPAPDAEALFCNRCGTGYKKEPENTPPLCPRCGFVIPDDQSQFCNRCGAAVGPGPADKKPACVKCGAIAPDGDTLFCNRCGTPFNSAVISPKPVHFPSHASHPSASVKISQKKQVPVAAPHEDLWDPVPHEEVDPAHYHHEVALPAKKKYAHLPLVAEELAGGKNRDESISLSGNTKKYAHLPLVADELKEKQSPRLEIESPYYPGPPRETKTTKSKKGLFDLLKK